MVLGTAFRLQREAAVPRGTPYKLDDGRNSWTKRSVVGERHFALNLVLSHSCVPVRDHFFHLTRRITRVEEPPRARDACRRIRGFFS